MDFHMSKRVLQVLEFVTEQTCTLLLCSLIPSVSPFKFLAQPFLGLGVHFWEMHSFLKQTFSMGQTEWSLPPLLPDFTWLCWEFVPSGSSENDVVLCAEGSMVRKSGSSDLKPSVFYRFPLKHLGKSWAKLVFTRNFPFATSFKKKRFCPLCSRNL